jgi:hypothetical protein
MTEELDNANEVASRGLLTAQPCAPSSEEQSRHYHSSVYLKPRGLCVKIPQSLAMIDIDGAQNSTHYCWKSPFSSQKYTKSIQSLSGGSAWLIIAIDNQYYNVCSRTRHLFSCFEVYASTHPSVCCWHFRVRLVNTARDSGILTQSPHGFRYMLLWSRFFLFIDPPIKS